MRIHWFQTSFSPAQAPSKDHTCIQVTSLLRKVLSIGHVRIELCALLLVSRVGARVGGTADETVRRGGSSVFMVAISLARGWYNNNDVVLEKHVGRGAMSTQVDGINEAGNAYRKTRNYSKRFLACV